MIVEFSKFNETVYTLPKEVKMTNKLSKELIEKIEKKKKEPFARVKLIILAPLLPDLIKLFKEKDISIKNIFADKIKIGIEI